MLKKVEILKKEKADIRTLMKFVAVYCREHHHGEKVPFSFRNLDIKEIEEKDVPVCRDCTGLLTYGLTMRMKCPHGEDKAKIREVMKFSGMYLVKHGRLDMLYHYLV